MDPTVKMAIKMALAKADVVAAMVAASDAGRPAVEAVDTMLTTHFRGLLHKDADKQQVGQLIREVLFPHKYVPLKSDGTAARGYESGIQRECRDTKTFTSGTVYTRVAR